jgi:hypothetical protein
VLYEHVHVLGSEEFLAVLRTIKGTTLYPLSHMAFESEPYPGWHTQRFDINFRDYEDFSPLQRCSASISSLCPNLRLLHIYTAQKYVDLLPLITDGETRLNHGIRYLRFRNDQDGDALVKWVSSFPILEVLIVDVYIYGWTDVNKMPHVSLPHLHTLEISNYEGSDISELVARWDLPSFRRLILNDTYSDARIPFDIIRKFGPQLAILDLTAADECNVLPYVLPRCTSLIELVVFATFPLGALDPHPTLERVVLEMDARDAEAFEEFMAMLFAKRGPRLRTIKVRSWNGVCAWSNVVLEGWEGKWGENSVRFEYDEADRRAYIPTVRVS